MIDEQKPVILKTVAEVRVWMRAGPGVQHEHVGWADGHDRLIYHQSDNGYAHVSVAGTDPIQCGWILEAVLIRAE